VESRHFRGDLLGGNRAARHAIHAIIAQDEDFSATDAGRHGDAVQDFLSLDSGVWHGTTDTQPQSIWKVVSFLLNRHRALNRNLRQFWD
jgi:hypothetical protein